MSLLPPSLSPSPSRRRSPSRAITQQLAAVASGRRSVSVELPSSLRLLDGPDSPILQVADLPHPPAPNAACTSRARFERH